MARYDEVVSRLLIRRLRSVSSLVTRSILASVAMLATSVSHAASPTPATASAPAPPWRDRTFGVTPLSDEWPPPPADVPLSMPLRLDRAGVELAVGLAGGVAWYVSRRQFNSQDWDLQWDVPSWRKKLTTTEAFRFDTNDFVTNGQDHSRAGVAYYLVGRANGLELPAAFALDLAASTAWEYLVEYRETVSINDLIVNSASGPAVGEPLMQIGRYFRRGRPTLLSRSLAALFSPFDQLNGILDRAPWPGTDEADELGLSVERGHWLRVFANGRSVDLGGGERRVDATVGIDLEVVGQRGYGRPGRFAGWQPGGTYSRLTNTFTFDDAGQFLGMLFRTSTTLTSYTWQDIRSDGSDDSRLRGYSLMVGAGGGFDFSTRTLGGGEYDRLLALSLAGPVMELSGHAGRLGVRWQLGAYGDFGMIDSHALGPEFPANPSPPLTGVLRAQGYYFGYGATGVSRVSVTCCWFLFETEVRGHHFDSFDGRSRVESPLDASFKDLSDDRLFATAALTFFPGNKGVGLSGFSEWVGRHGRMGTMSRSSSEFSLGVQATVMR